MLFDNLSQLLFRFHIYYKLVDVKHLQNKNVRSVQKKKKSSTFEWLSLERKNDIAY